MVIASLHINGWWFGGTETVSNVIQGADVVSTATKKVVAQ
jgi:hypothetical protein